jgi:hypothetical protein
MDLFEEEFFWGGTVVSIGVNPHWDGTFFMEKLSIFLRGTVSFSQVSYRCEGLILDLRGLPIQIERLRELVQRSAYSGCSHR